LLKTNRYGFEIEYGPDTCVEQLNQINSLDVLTKYMEKLKEEQAPQGEDYEVEDNIEEIDLIKDRPPKQF